MHPIQTPKKAKQTEITTTDINFTSTAMIFTQNRGNQSDRELLLAALILPDKFFVLIRNETTPSLNMVIESSWCCESDGVVVGR